MSRFGLIKPMGALLACGMTASGCGASLTSSSGLSTGSLASYASDTTIVASSPVTVYTLVARGANSCWLGPDGTLHGTHRLYANVKPVAKGGGATLLIYRSGNASAAIPNKVTKAPDAAASTNVASTNTGSTNTGSTDKAPRGRAALRILLDRASAGRTSLTVLNRSLSADQAAIMATDVRRWAKGSLTCTLAKAISDPSMPPLPTRPTSKLRPKHANSNAK